MLHKLYKLGKYQLVKYFILSRLLLKITYFISLKKKVWFKMSTKTYVFKIERYIRTHFTKLCLFSIAVCIYVDSRIYNIYCTHDIWLANCFQTIDCIILLTLTMYTHVWGFYVKGVENEWNERYMQYEMVPHLQCVR